MGAAAAGLGLVISMAGASCRQEQLAAYRCQCEFLTDFDDASAQTVEVCSASLERAAEVARGCAQSAAPAPVQSCQCQPAPGPSSACASEQCRPLAHRE